MIRFTLESNGKGIWVNHEHIVDVIENSAGKTNITFAHDSYQVTESPEEVARKVLEYRLATERYKTALLQSEFVDPSYVSLREERNLRLLVGLEEQKDE